MELAGRSDRPLHDTLAAAWIAGFQSKRTRAAYEVGLRGWFGWCETNGSDPLRVARAHVDLWVRQLEAAGLADRTVNLRAEPDTRRASAWLSRPQLADFFAAARDLGPHPHALIALLALNGLRIAEACGLDVGDRTVSGFYPQLQITRKGGHCQLITLARPTEHAIVALQCGANPDQVMHDGGWTDTRMVSYYAHGKDDPARSVTHAVAGVVLSS